MANLTNQTLLQWLQHHAKARPDAIAIEIAGSKTSYAELASDVGKLASGLTGLGIDRGDVVAAQLPNIREYVVAFLAVTARGAIFQTLHMPYRSSELGGLLGDSAAKAVIVTNTDKLNRAQDVLAVRGTLPALKHVIVMGKTIDGTHDLKALLNTTANPADLHISDPEDDFLLLYTSGTTAKPKGVPHVYSSFLNNALSSAEEMEIGPEARVMSLAAMTHLYGLFTVLMSLSAGATQVLLPMFHPATILDDIKAAAPTHIYAAPAHFSGAVASGALKSGHLRSAKLICLSGAAVPRTLAQAIDEKMTNGGVIQLWGMSELQAGCFGRLADPVETRLTSCGRAAPKTELRVRDEAGKALAAGAEGALEVHGPSIFKGYLNRPEDTAKSFSSDGWFATGDLAKIDADGYVAITGRTKVLINRGGVKYNPVEVEDVLLGLAGVENCAVVPMPDPAMGERGCLCVTLVPGATLTLEQATASLAAAGLAKYKWPERLEVFDELPMTPTRKVIRADLSTEIMKRKRTPQ